jgi:F-type H+-transporting ATPase subunit epsilon
LANLRLEIVTADSVVYEDDVEIVVIPGIEGQLGILPHHAPLLTALQPGELVLRKEGEETAIAVSGGFVQVLDDKVIVLADSAERAEEINEERAQEAMRRAEERLENRTEDMNLGRALASIRRAQSRLKVAQRRRHRRSDSVQTTPND